MGNALRDAMKRYKGDAGVEPVVQALLKKQPRSEAKQAVESPDLTDDEIMARLAALDELLTDDEKSFKPFLMEIAEQIVKASASAGFLGIGKSSNERELAFLNKLKSAMKM